MAEEPFPGPGWTPGATASPDARSGGAWAALRDFVRERLPESLHGGRFDPGPRGALALGGLALLAALAALVVAWTAVARPVATPTAGTSAKPAAAQPKVTVPPLGGATALPAGGTSSGTPASQVVVDVAGAVRRPGLVRLKLGARVADAITSAGGTLPGTSTVGLSLARKLVDGEQLVVGIPQPAPASGGSSGPAGAAGAVVDLNTASLGELDALPGIGPVLAQRILDWREQHGGFTSVDQLQQVSGLGGRKFESLKPLVSV